MRVAKATTDVHGHMVKVGPCLTETPTSSEGAGWRDYWRRDPWSAVVGRAQLLSRQCRSLMGAHREIPVPQTRRLNHSSTKPMPDDDAELRAQLEALHAESFAWAVTCCGRNPAEAEDVLQMSYLRILEGQARHAGKSAFKSWLFGVIRMTAREQRRRTWFRWLRSAPLESAPEQAALTPTPDEAAACGETAAEVSAALARLPARQREVLMLIFHHDLTLDAAAEVMRVSPGSARTHYQRGKRRLRGLLPQTLLQP